MSSIEAHLAALEAWREAVIESHLAGVDPDKAAACRAVGMTAATFARNYLVGPAWDGTERPQIRCLRCGGSGFVEDANLLAKVHLESCVLAPEPTTRQPRGLFARRRGAASTRG